MREDTVAAISTPFGKGGVAVVRISGPDAIAIGDSVFIPHNKKPLSAQQTGRLVYGEILRGERTVDYGMAVCFRAPHSFTGEDTVELHCHGGILLTQTVLESVLLCGAQAAGAGEFTRRAFLNGKMDLSQAEAVIDLIEAESTEHLQLALSQVKGVLGARVRTLADALYELLCSTYAYIDYPDEDLTDVTAEELLSRLQGLEWELCELCDTYHTGRAVAQGIPTVLFGRPNTGKSSLLNVLLGADRAIVTAEAGTTRDTIEETASIGRVRLRLCDTAGIRQADGVEGIGVRRAMDKLAEAELVLAVFDGSEPLTEEDEAVLAHLRTLCEEREVATIAVLNKCDLPQCIEYHRLTRAFDSLVEISCEKGRGIDDLRAAIERLFVAGQIDYAQPIVSNARQYAALHEARVAVTRAREALEQSYTQDVACLDLEAALGALHSLSGREVGQEIVDGIFSRFCVGK